VQVQVVSRGKHECLVPLVESVLQSIASSRYLVSQLPRRPTNSNGSDHLYTARCFVHVEQSSFYILVGGGYVMRQGVSPSPQGFQEAMRGLGQFHIGIETPLTPPVIKVRACLCPWRAESAEKSDDTAYSRAECSHQQSYPQRELLLHLPHRRGLSRRSAVC
jgi:hypothetical protein